MAQPFFGGIHPNDKKAATNKKPIEKLPPPARVVIPMSMHIGAPCQPCVAVGDTVTVGQRVGEPAAFVSAPVHASISGKVVAVEPRIHFSGVPVMSVVIENDFNNTPCPDIHPVERPGELTAEALCEIIQKAHANVAGIGIVIEKGFQQGGKLLREKGLRVESLAIVDGMDADTQTVQFRD